MERGLLAKSYNNGKLVRFMTAKALGIVCRYSKNMTDSAKRPVKNVLKVILTEGDIPGAPVSLGIVQ